MAHGAARSRPVGHPRPKSFDPSWVFLYLHVRAASRRQVAANLVPATGTVELQARLRKHATVPWATRGLHQHVRHLLRFVRGVYGPGVPRINLHLSEDLYTRLVAEARKGGVRPTSWAREAIAWRIGRAEARDEVAELRERIARLERELRPGV